MDAYRAQQQGYGHPLTIIMSKKLGKEAKPHGENPPSRQDMRGKPKNSDDAAPNQMLMSGLNTTARWKLGPCRTTNIQ